MRGRWWWWLGYDCYGGWWLFRLWLWLATEQAHVVLVNGDWVDPDTPWEHLSTRALSKGDDRSYQLVFSDEFEQEGRTFRDGYDPRWTAINKNDYTNAALHYYSHDNAETSEGMLKIVTELKTNSYRAFDEDKKKYYADKKFVQTAMLQGWNKFCFVGGIVEFRAKLPGKPDIGGLWPALWMLGNLARATYVGSSDFVWPFSYNQCTEEHRLSQQISACSKVNHYGLASYQGRGAPEIDLIESMQGEAGKLPNTHVQRPYQSASYQVAPGVESHRPELGTRPDPRHWYNYLEYGNETNADLNPFFYGVTLVHKPRDYTYQSDALSANMQLNDTHYNDHHLYRVEWEPPAPDGKGGYIRWYTDHQFVYGVVGKTLELIKTEIPSEPMYLIMNTAVSSHWGFPAPCPSGCDCECFECGNRYCECGLPDGYCDNFPATLDIDHVRVYQARNEPKHVLGCSPPQRPTSLFIQGHAQRYMEKGQKRPLEPVKRGGGTCSNHSHCGGRFRGRCHARHNTCVCAPNTTGPHCLAHLGWYDPSTTDNDEDDNERKTSLHVTRMEFPVHFVGVVIVLVAWLVLAVLFTVRHKHKTQPVSSFAGTYRDVPSALQTSYYLQSTTAAAFYDGGRGGYQTSPVSYVLPPKQNTVTYCVIDERMMDHNATLQQNSNNNNNTNNNNRNNIYQPQQDYLRSGEMLSPLKQW